MTNQQAFENGLQYYLNKGDKIEDMRDDIKYRQLAIDLGYSVVYPESFGGTLSFTKKKKTIWFCRKGWACAVLVDGMFQGHRYYDDLKTALEKESK